MGWRGEASDEPLAPLAPSRDGWRPSSEALSGQSGAYENNLVIEGNVVTQLLCVACHEGSCLFVENDMGQA